MDIISYFGNYKKANKTVTMLNEKGFKSFVDLNEHYINDKNVDVNMPGTETSTSLSNLVLNSGSNYTDATKTPLKAADPNVSGLANPDEIFDINFKVITNIDSNKKEAIKIIKNMGGYLEDQHVNRK